MKPGEAQIISTGMHTISKVSLKALKRLLDVVCLMLSEKGMLCCKA